MSDRLFLYCHLFDVFLELFSAFDAAEYIDDLLLEAAEDPDLGLRAYAQLLRYADVRLGR